MMKFYKNIMISEVEGCGMHVRDAQFLLVLGSSQRVRCLSLLSNN